MPAIYRESLRPRKVLPLAVRPQRSHRKALPFPHRYLELMRQTKILSWPRFSLVPKVFAGCCESLLEVGSSRCYLYKSFSTCLDPYPGCLCSAHTRYFPQSYGLPGQASRSALGLYPYYGNFSMVTISRLQSFTNVQTHGFARHSGCSHHSQLDWAAVTFTSEHLTDRYLTAPRIC
jgi:hypothetical protein